MRLRAGKKKHPVQLHGYTENAKREGVLKW